MKIRNLLYWLLVFLLVAMMLLSGTMVVRYVIDSRQQKQVYDELASQVARSRAEAVLQTAPAVSADLPQPDPAVPTEPVILPEYASPFAENPDLVGWMTIDGTPIDYPVMQTPDRENYYLHRNFKRESNAHGCLYVRESCNVFAPSDNLTIYGHHMRDGSMFASLESYRKEAFRAQYPTIRFDTLYERHTYTVFAVFTTTASVGEGFSYHLFEDASSETEFNDFVAACKALSLYDTGITPRYGDKLICLSTCEYSQANGRLVVVAVRD